MHDLNDFYFFHAVVTHQGFTAAARKIGVPKATLSKRVARLEDQLQVRLLERSTRRLRTTDVGRRFFDQCESMLAGVEAATAVAAEARVEPQGMIRLSCPQGLIQGLFAEVLPGFLLAYPNVRVQVRMFNRPVDLIDDGVDVALRARTRLDPDSNLIMRSLARSWLVLAMSPALLRSAGDTLQVQDLANLPTLSMEDAEDAVWELVGPSDETVTIRHQPRLLCGNFDVLRQAAIDGVGVALLPQHICQTSFDSGELIHALPGWHTQYGLIHAVYLTRKGLLPAVRALIDYLALEFPKRLQGA